MLARPDPPSPPLTRVTETPAFAPDGSLQTIPGYHPASQTFYAPPPGLHVHDVPARPSKVDLGVAKALILEVLADFPFVSQADEAHAIALFLLPYVRDLIPGATPNHLIEAPTPGSGKGLLADVLLRPATGQHVGIVTEARDDEEWRKRLTSRLREARTVLLLDNVRRPLDSGQLAAALTGLVWEDRLLGTNETIRVPVRCVWVTTANNPLLSLEMARRSIRIRPNLAGSHDTKQAIADQAGVSRETVRKAEVIIQEADEPTKQALRRGERSIHGVYTQLRPRQATSNGQPAQTTPEPEEHIHMTDRLIKLIAAMIELAETLRGELAGRRAQFPQATWATAYDKMQHDLGKMQEFLQALSHRAREAQDRRMAERAASVEGSAAGTIGS
jgi:hypothetical protein